MDSRSSSRSCGYFTFEDWRQLHPLICLSLGPQFQKILQSSADAADTAGKVYARDHLHL